MQSGDRIQQISGCSVPNYTPARHNAYFVINGCTEPELYFWNGTVWKKLNGGGGGGDVYTDGAISGDGSESSPIKLSQNGATTGQVLVWDGTDWVPSLQAIEQDGVINPTNLVTNGTFSSGLTGWRQTAGKWQVIGGVLSKMDLLTYRDSLMQDIALQLDSMYQLTVTISAYTSGGINFNVGGMYGATLKSNGTFTQEFTVTRNGAGIYLQDLFNSVLGIDNIILKKITKIENSFQSDLNLRSNVSIGGVIKSGESAPQIWGYFRGGTAFGNGPWSWAPNQPPVSIGMNGMKNGTGVSIGAEACDFCGPLSYSTTMGIRAGKRNVSGHLTAYGTGAAQNANSDAAVFGDEAGASATTYPINAHGYYCLNLSTTGLSTGIGHECFRYATTGDNSGVGYQLGLNTTTGRINGIGSQVGWHNTTGRMIGIGRDAGGGQSTTLGANVEDTEMIYIGDGTKKNTNSTLTNSTVIGHGAVITKSNQFVLGTENTDENLFFGKLGFNVTPINKITTYSDVNDFDGMLLINGNIGNLASAGTRFQTAGNTLDINMTGANHAVWPSTARWFSPASSVFWNTSVSPHDFYTGGVLRFKINETGTTNYGNNRTSGDLMVGSLDNPSEKMHLKGDYIRIGNMGVNGTPASPVKYGLKFFANNDSRELGRIESLNSLNVVDYGRFDFSLKNPSNIMQRVAQLNGEDKSLLVENLAGFGTKITQTDNTGKITASSLDPAIIVTTSTKQFATVWTTATRPTPSGGEHPIGFNTTTGKHEGWDGSAWNSFY